MSIWNVLPVAEQPGVTLVRWRILATERGKRYFVGHCRENHEGRVSSAIQSIDPTTRRGVTQSGRVYELVGPPGLDLDALYVWEIWAAAKDFGSYLDVTDEIAAAFQPSTQEKPPAC